jgi:hypothetical protein
VSTYFDIFGTLSRTQTHKFHESKWQWHSAGRCRRSRTSHNDVGSHVHSSHIRWWFCRRSSSILCHHSRCRTCLSRISEGYEEPSGTSHRSGRSCPRPNTRLSGNYVHSCRWRTRHGTLHLREGWHLQIHIYPGLITPHLLHVAHQS